MTLKEDREMQARQEEEAYNSQMSADAERDAFERDAEDEAQAQVEDEAQQEYFSLHHSRV